jgi:hypothetical protein
MAANISPLEVPQLPALRLFLDLLPETISRSSRRTSATRPWPSGGSTTRAGAAIGLQCRDGHVVALALSSRSSAGPPMSASCASWSTRKPADAASGGRWRATRYARPSGWG